MSYLIEITSNVPAKFVRQAKGVTGALPEEFFAQYIASKMKSARTACGCGVVADGPKRAQNIKNAMARRGVQSKIVKGRYTESNHGAYFWPSK